METQQVNSEKAKESTPENLFELLSSSSGGLSVDEAKKRLEQYGPNALEEKKESQLLKFLAYFWGPIPWMIEVALILSVVVKHWVDVVIIGVLLVFNAVIGFWEEHRASNALAALKAGLALKARALRGGKWQEVGAADLVPGDIVRLRLGDIIPADVKLLEGDYISIDQAALTGESLPVNKKAGDIAYSGSVAKQGEMVALVTGTGVNTFFGRTAKLVGEAGAVSHFQKAVMRIGDFLIFVAVGLSIILIAVELYRGEPALELVQFVLILVIASIPVAMPAVLSMTMALGALSLSKEKAIVSRLQAIEEMAGIDILCCDKTGTLTKNELTLGDPVVFGAKDPEDLILAGALASKAENRDAIDLAVISGLKDKSLLDNYNQTKFTPFDPVGKRTEGTATGPDGQTVMYTKGAPQVILGLCDVDEQAKAKAEKVVDEMAAKGYRTLGVAESRADGAWKYLGILPLSDPPRDDSAETIVQAKKHGLKVHMVTGDNVAIASEISGQLGMGTHIQPATDLFRDNVDPAHLSAEAAEKIEQADGFAQVFPEHKYGIVKALQDRGHLVGMTGDGVNDAPALKQADTGIAVSGATDAARAAAALVLTAPGLSVIIKAIEEARKIFERMMSYTIYRISMTIDIMFFVVLAMLSFNFTPLTAVMIILLALLDDIPIMTIAYDNTRIDPKPVRWQMKRVLSISSVLGLVAVAETFGLLLIGWEWLKNPEWQQWMHMDKPHLQTMLFLQLVAGGHLMLFVTRSKKFFFMPPFPSWPLFSAVVGTQIFAVLMCAFGWLVPPLPWALIGIVWAYNIVWMFIQDIIKIGVYHLIEDRAKHKQKYLKSVNQPLHAHPHLSG
ncbi:MAG: plasma-membrane proton-efflux P-type ATPase [Desulfobacterales bacterium C00003060]|nr:MAG: plasma-membrane proton-efflux P-type ATPase [Desulfobacterales bacterium C00003060]